MQPATVVSLYRKTRIDRSLMRAIEAGERIREVDARRDKSLGFAARWMVMLSLPYRDEPGRRFWTRVNGDETLIIHSGFESTGETVIDANGNEQAKVRYLGIPFGALPRLILAWMATEAKKKQTPEIELGDTVRDFFDKLGIKHASGGKEGSITAVKNQMRRLMSAQIKVETRGVRPRGQNVNIVDTVKDDTEHWWLPAHNKQRTLWQPRITLSESFFKGLREDAVPIDLRAIRALTASPLAIDLYCFITWRVNGLASEDCIGWGALQRQMGSDSRKHKFVENVRHALRRVKGVYPGIEKTVTADGRGLVIAPSPTSVPSRDVA